MDFELPVSYKGEELAFYAQLFQLTYTYRFVVDVYGQEVLFERNEECNYMALIDLEQLVS
jgi:hypothetical protein